MIDISCFKKINEQPQLVALNESISLLPSLPPQPNNSLGGFAKEGISLWESNSSHALSFSLHSNWLRLSISCVCSDKIKRK